MKKYLDKKISFEERKKIYEAEVIDKMMNPVKNFNPDKFEPMGSAKNDEEGQEEEKLAQRARIIPPKILPTFDTKPKQIREGQMIGMYESKQDIYLIFAYRCNALQDEIDNLKQEINLLKK